MMKYVLFLIKTCISRFAFCLLLSCAKNDIHTELSSSAVFILVSQKIAMTQLNHSCLNFF